MKKLEEFRWCAFVGFALCVFPLPAFAGLFDVNRDQFTTCHDVDAWNQIYDVYQIDPVAFQVLIPFLDLSNDGTADLGDRDYLVQVGLNTNYGDANCDGRVGVDDMVTVIINLDEPGAFKWSDGDFDGDGDVDMSDLSILGSNWGATGVENWNEL